MLASELPGRYLLEMSLGLKPQEKEGLYSKKFHDLVRQSQVINDERTLNYEKGMDALEWMMRHDQNFYLPDCLMVKTDIASMTNSLEVRCPFLDHEFVEFTSTIPSAYKRDNSGGKMILKSAVRSILPEDILTKHKTGFGIPLGKWLRTDMNGFLKETLSGEQIKKRGLFNDYALNKMIQEHSSGKRDWSHRLWALIMLELWFKEFID